MTALELTSAQRRYLKQHAHALKPLMQMGKEGPTANFIAELLEQLGAHELIKVRILNNCLAELSDIENALAGAGITLIQKVGHVLTVFKQKPQDSWFRLPQK